MSAVQAFFAGGVTLRALGVSTERLVNLAVSRGVTLRNVRRESGRGAVFTVSYKDFFALRATLRDAGVKVRILHKTGMPHLQSMLRYRSMLVAGGALCLLLMLGLTQIVWDVRMVGDIDVEQRLIIAETLEVMKIHRGMPRAKLDTREVVRAVEREIGSFVYVGARIRGVALEVEIVPVPEQPQMIPYDIPADLVADKEGVVESVMVREGTAAVRPGQAVRPGDVLIYGRAVGPGGEIEVHAQGDVVLRVRVQADGDAPLALEKTEPTGRYANRRTLMLCGIPLPVYGEAPFERCAVASRETEILPGLYLPAVLMQETLHEMRTIRTYRDEEDVHREAERLASLAALEKAPPGRVIVDKWVEFSKMKGTTLRASVVLEILETVGVWRER